MKEGIISEKKGRIFPYDSYAGALYGFNNKYGATCRIAVGGTNPTKVGEDPKKDTIELSIVGLTVEPQDLDRMFVNLVPYLYDSISEEDYAEALRRIAQLRTEPDMVGIDPMKKYNEKERKFEGLNHLEMVKILRDLKSMPERKRIRETSEELRGIILDSKLEKYYPTLGGRE